MKQYSISVKCQMVVDISVMASSREEVEEWVKRGGPSVYSVIETPVHVASGVELDSINEISARGFCPDIRLPVNEELF